MANRATAVFVLFMLMTTSMMALSKDAFILEEEELSNPHPNLQQLQKLRAGVLGTNGLMKPNSMSRNSLHKQMFLQVLTP